MTKKRTGRPSEYSPQRVEEFLKLVALGYSVADICRRDDMPNKDTIYVWLEKNRDFADKYAVAKEKSAEKYADEIVQIADDVALNKVAVDKARLQIDARKWVAAKLKPKKYGELVKHDMQHSGSVGLTLNINLGKFTKPNDQN